MNKLENIQQILAEQTPAYDEAILKDFFKPRLEAIRRDVRLLPNSQKRIWLEATGRKRYGKGRKRDGSRKCLFSKQQHRDALNLMDARLLLRLKSLPKKQRRKERKLRTYQIGSNFIGRHKTAKWEGTAIWEG